MSKTKKEEIRELKENLDKLRIEIHNLQVSVNQLRGRREDALKMAAERQQIPTSKTDFRQRRLLRGHYNKVYALQWQPEANTLDEADRLVSASQDGKLIIWNAQSTNKLRLITLKSSWVMTCAYAPGGQLVGCGGLDNMCTIFSTDDTADESKPVAELRHHEGYLSSCKFINKNEILTASGDSLCILWDINKQAVKMIFDSHSSDVMSVSINPDKKIFVSGSCDTTAKVFDMGSGDCVGTFVGHEADINAVEWFRDDQAFASGSDDSTLRFFDRRAYSQLNHYAEGKFISGVTSLCFSTSGKYLFGGYDDSPYAVVWDTLTASPSQILGILSTRVSYLGMHSRGFALATGSWDNHLRIWA